MAYSNIYLFIIINQFLFVCLNNNLYNFCYGDKFYVNIKKILLDIIKWYILNFMLKTKIEVVQNE